MLSRLSEGITALWRPTPGRTDSLDGLRGLAILLVVASHVTASRLPLGGMIGVTLFFVLSGFLITSQLVRESERTGRVDFKAFYARRALRLLPALVVMLLVTPVVLWLAEDPALTARVIPASLVVLFYLSDFFRAAGDTLVVYGHTWSLAVEEQFYLVWPVLLVLVLMRYLPRKATYGVLIALAVAFGLWRVTASAVLPFERTYFSVDTNALGLVLGAVLAFRRPVWSNRMAGVVAIAATLALLLFAVIPLEPKSDMYYLGLTYGAPVAALLGAVAIAGARLVRGPLSFPPLVFFGRISYGLYLWHDVLLQMNPGGEPINDKWRAVAVLAATVLAVASWVLVEYPALQMKKRFERAEAASPQGLVDSAAVGPARQLNR